MIHKLQNIHFFGNQVQLIQRTVMSKGVEYKLKKIVFERKGYKKLLSNNATMIVTPNKSTAAMVAEIAKKPNLIQLTSGAKSSERNETERVEKTQKKEERNSINVLSVGK